MLPLYRTVMDPNVNPLRATPPAQRFQMMVYLSVMWTAIFCAAAGAWFWYGQILAVHLLFAAGFLITGLTFHAADRPAPIARPAERRNPVFAAPDNRDP
jgi:hypothetical protein